MRVAVVHDWLETYAGSERVLEEILCIYPQADLFAVVDFLKKDDRFFIQNKMVETTFIQKLPYARKKYRAYLPLMPIAVEQLDLTGYNLVISSSHAVAKGVLTGPDQLHISYVHSPIRYAWDLQHLYLKESGLNHGIKGLIARMILHYIRLWDSRTANGVDEFIANSNFIARRIKKIYGRKAKVIYPPVNIIDFPLKSEKENFYLTASRLVSYKRIDLIVEVFSRMPDKKLIVIGDGPEFKKLKANNYPNITILGYQPFNALRDYMQRAQAFVFAGEEDFGIILVEAQACGTPVIAYAKGGALEIVKGLEKEKPTGVFFERQDVESLKSAVHCFERNSTKLRANACHENAMRFSSERFQQEMYTFIQNRLNNF